MMMPTMPIALTDSQLAELMAVARQLPPALRAQYLETVAALLRGCEVTDAAVRGACHASVGQVQGRTAAPASGCPVE